MTTDRRAYVLLQIEAGKVASVANALRGGTAIRAADVVTGLYDIVVIVEGTDADAIARTVLDVIQTTNGVERSTTYMVINPGREA